jgi:hypothetical protein
MASSANVTRSRPGAADSRYLRICTGPDLDTTGGLETRVTPGNQNAQTTCGQLPESDAPTGYEMVEHRVQ